LTPVPAAGLFRYPSTGGVRSGSGAAELLGSVLDELGISRALAVLTPSVARDSHTVDRLQASAGGRLTVFAAIQPHTPYDTVLSAARAARTVAADGLVSVGGGSAIDTARLAALCVGEGVNTAPDLHELRVQSTPGGPRFPAISAHALPHVALPTTLSAAEFSDGGAATCPWTGRKELFVGPSLACRMVLADPALACGTPAQTWAMTGIRALDHAVETILSPRASALTDELSCAAIVHLRRSLPAVLAAPADEAARAEGQLGSWLSYFGVANGTLGLSHAIGHQLGAQLGIAHGLASCIALPDVVLHLAPFTVGRLRLAARAFEVDRPGTEDRALPERVAGAIDSLIRQLGLPRRLHVIDASPVDLERLADAVLGDFLVEGTPGGPPSRDDLIGLLASLT
jgi:alcohol dehydrogenase class IV